MSQNDVIKDAINAYTKAFMGLEPNETVPFERLMEVGELNIQITRKLISQELSWTPTKEELDEIKNRPRTSKRFID